MAFIVGDENGNSLSGDRNGVPENDIIMGNGGNDVLSGLGGVDILTGDAGRDLLFGGDAGDFLNGGDEVGPGDTLVGNAGADTILGGAGADVFVYLLKSDSLASGRDTIRDFQHDVDRINLAPLDAREGQAGNQDFAFIGGSGFTGEGQVRSTLEFFNGNVNTILQINTSGSSGAEMEIRLTGTPVLDAGDFIL